MAENINAIAGDGLDKSGYKRPAPETIDELDPDGYWLAVDHWPVFSPGRFAKLVAEGRLVAVAHETDELIEARTIDVYLGLVKVGWTPDAAIIEGRAVALREIVYDRDETDGETAPRARRVSK